MVKGPKTVTSDREEKEVNIMGVSYKWTPERKALRAQYEKDLALGCTKSALFARMATEHNLTVGEIAFVVGSHYSFVYGVVSTKTDRVTAKTDNKADEIRRLADEGKTPGEISHMLNTNYSYVHTVCKKHKAG